MDRLFAILRWVQLLIGLILEIEDSGEELAGAAKKERVMLAAMEQAARLGIVAPSEGADVPSVQIFASEFIDSQVDQFNRSGVFGEE